ncbi:MAG: hypothetical protein A2992_04905 [Elusimicrobia bacterium RIFCSPLOWO2_01_FULL_59_12]|nr:MAG: hypothetical protein A2992_04905 [Elusimicrobia bacterium RIFCSPLOWO2_01_FULL_59_12]
MGEAYTAVADDASSLHWNPAGIALLNQGQAAFMYNQSYQDMTFSNVGAAIPLESGGIGVNMSYLGFGKIDGYDDSGNAAGNVNAYNGVATLGGAWLGDFLSLGLNAKGIQGSLADEKANGAAFDVGANFVYPEELFNGSTLRLAVAGRNLGSGMKYLRHKDPFPTQWRLGTTLLQAFRRKLNLSLDYGKMRDANGAVYGGAEYWPVSMLALRGGYSGEDVEGNGLRAGIGLRLGDFSFDYAFSDVGDLGLAHRYEVCYRFGAIRPLLSPEMRKMLRQAKRAIREERYARAVLLLDALIKMEPRYKLFHRLAKGAMRGNEAQERLAASNQYKYGGRNTKSAVETAYDRTERQELEDLLNTTETGVLQVSVPQEKKP